MENNVKRAEYLSIVNSFELNKFKLKSRRFKDKQNLADRTHGFTESTQLNTKSRLQTIFNEKDQVREDGSEPESFDTCYFRLLQKKNEKFTQTSDALSCCQVELIKSQNGIRSEIDEVKKELLELRLEIREIQEEFTFCEGKKNYFSGKEVDNCVESIDVSSIEIIK